MVVISVSGEFAPKNWQRQSASSAVGKFRVVRVARGSPHPASGQTFESANRHDPLADFEVADLNDFLVKVAKLWQIEIAIDEVLL